MHRLVASTMRVKGAGQKGLINRRLARVCSAFIINYPHHVGDDVTSSGDIRNDLLSGFAARRRCAKPGLLGAMLADTGYRRSLPPSCCCCWPECMTLHWRLFRRRERASRFWFDATVPFGPGSEIHVVVPKNAVQCTHRATHTFDRSCPSSTQ
jgi:hypothetical protein